MGKPRRILGEKIIAFCFHVVKVAFVIYNGNFTGDVDPTYCIIDGKKRENHNWSLTGA